MATVLAEPGGVSAEELVHFSIPILKWEEDPDGDLVVKGIATDGTIDSDSQIVDPEWSAKALQTWIATGGNLRQSHDPHRPVGKGLRVDVNKDNSGKHWVTSVVVDPLAQRLVKKGVLTAYSVGISRPVIKHDPSGRARGGIIVDGELAELSLVDRPSNKSSYLELAKSAANGTCEFTGKMVGADELEKMLDESAIQKDISSFDPGELGSLDISFTPNDMASLVMKKVRDKVISDHYSELAKDATGYDPFRYSTAEKRNFDPGVGGGVDRDRLAESDFAGPHRSFPIVNQSDVSDALSLAHHADDPAGVRARIKAIARRKGLTAPDDDGGKKEDIPDVIKDPATAAPSTVGAEGSAASASPGKKVPNSQNLDADGDTDGDGIGAIADFTGNAGVGVKAAKPKMPKPKKGSKGSKGGKGGKKLPPWLNKPGSDDSSSCKLDHSHTEKCHVDPKTASGASDAADMDPAPVGELLEYPAAPHMKAQAVSLRYKTIGIDSDMGALHDFTCPAYSPEDIHGYHPFADFSTLINENLWQRKALAAAAGRSIDEAMEAQKAWQAAAILKTADIAELNAYRLEMHKAFRDANPGPTSYPSPGAISAQRFNRPCVTDGHSQNSGGYGPPNSAAQVATSPANARNFNRPPLGGMQESPSPSFMKSGAPYPSEPGVPTQISYPQIEREKARRALSMMHDHLAHMFPSVCPMLDQDAYRVETTPPTVMPSIAGVGKAIEPEQQAEVLSDVYKYIRKLEKRVRAGKITEEEARTRLSKHTAENYARRLAKDVQKGMTNIDEVRKALGIEVTEKVTMPAVAVPVAPAKAKKPANKGTDPEVIKSMMSEILQPFQAQIVAQTEKIGEYQNQLEAQQERIAEYDKRWEALANTANPNTEAFTAALRKNMGPAGLVVKQQAEISDHVNGMMMRQLERTWRTSENPAEREAAYTALNKMKNTFE